MNRIAASDDLYAALGRARAALGGYRYLRDGTRGTGIPDQGVYFFFDDEEPRTDRSSLRVVRVGTHAVSDGSTQRLSQRLNGHRGSLGGANPGGGNHRGSIFRRHVGAALIERDGWPEAGTTWATDLPPGVRPSAAEQELERSVSDYLRALPFVWLDVPGPASRTSDRAVIERGAIALLSNRNRDRDPIDPPSPQWLGRHARDARIRESGLWNVKHVDDPWTDGVLDLIHRYTPG